MKSLDTETVVVKIGTALLTAEDRSLNESFVSSIAAQLAALRATDRYHIAVVTSGAVAAGTAATGIITDAADIVRRQALASIGQSRLMRSYERTLATHDLHAGQVLLQASTFEDTRAMAHLRNTIHALWQMGGIPVVNENDVLATKELTYMSNDTLAAQLGNAINASHLVLLTNQHGIYDKNPDEHADATLQHTLVAGHYEHIRTHGKSTGGTGGASLKLDAANAFRGTTYVAHGHRADLQHLLAGSGGSHTQIQHEARSMTVYI